MDDKKSNEILTVEEIKKRIKPVLEEYGVKEVYLFGSYARGEADKLSDVDLLMNLDNFEYGAWGKNKITFQSKLTEVLGKLVNILTLEQINVDYLNESAFSMEVMKERKRII